MDRQIQTRPVVRVNFLLDVASVLIYNASFESNSLGKGLHESKKIRNECSKKDDFSDRKLPTDVIVYKDPTFEGMDKQCATLMQAVTAVLCDLNC